MSSLYRKYRPQLFSQVEGHTHILKTLQSAIMHDQISHAYLFCGTRGSGKTTLARIFSKTINCENLKDKIANKKIKSVSDIEPCYKCNACNSDSYDIQEIDAASHRGIDEIRGIQESARVASFGGGYKVFIIDETHMLSTQACNALLKVLEEPPAHVIFILATTEAHKILPTILSRVQRFDFKPLKIDEISAKLLNIAESEKIQADRQAIELIAKAGRGSLRDAESIMERLIILTDGKLDEKSVSKELGIITPEEIDKFLIDIKNLKSQESLKWVNDKATEGAKFEHITTQLIERLREKYIIESSDAVPQKYAIHLIKLFSRAQLEQHSAIVASLPLEIATLEAIQAFGQSKKSA